MRDSRRTVGRWAAFAVVGALSAAAMWRKNERPDSPQAAAVAIRPAAASDQTVVGNAQAQPSNAANESWPVSLAGSSPPRLPTDGRGHLLHSRAVRDFFDYFLTAQSEMSGHALDALVRRQIAAQLDGTAAAAQAVDVWQRYNAYLNALAQQPQAPAQAQISGKADFDALQLALDQRDTVGARWLGEWDAPFFGAQAQRQHTDLARLRIAADQTLTDEQKAARLTMFDAALSPEERAARERSRQQQTAIDAIAQAQKTAAPPDALRAQITQTLGPEAAERVVQMQNDDAAWHAKYTDYAGRRTQIEQQDLPQPQRDAQIAQLRQQVFANPGDALRAASLDRGAGG